MRNDREGGVLVMVVMVFLVLSILTMSIIYMFSTNTKQIVAQEDHMQAYYLAQSGVEIGYAAIENYYIDTNNQLVGANQTVTLNEKVELTDAGGEINSITISRADDWITISAEAKHLESNTISTATMKYPIENPYLREWSK